MSKEINNKILEMFTLDTYNGDVNRDWMLTPFTINDLAISTDAHAMCYIDKSKVSGIDDLKTVNRQ